MTRLARRNKSRWHNLMKKRGLFWMRRGWCRHVTWCTTVLVSDEPVKFIIKA